MDLIIKNGTVITATDTFKADVGISNGKITHVAREIAEQAGETIDATGLLVFPGFIDVHTHFQLPFMGTVSADDFENGSKSCACGGVTTYIDFAIQGKGKSLFETVEARRKQADAHTYIDYSLHMGVTDVSDHVLAEIPKIIESGIPSFKLFMTYRKEGFMVDDGILLAVMEIVRDSGGIVGVHAENAAVLEYYIDKFVKEGKTAPPWHGRSRPNFVEAEAIKRVIYFTELTGSRLYIFHMSTGEGAYLVGEAKGRGAMVFSETCPQYLLLTDEKYEGEDGIYYPTSPPLRRSADNAALWRGLSNGSIQVVATDHCSFTKEQKMMGKDVFTKIPNGLPGIETLVPIMYSEGVVKGRMSVNQMVALLSSNPAKLFGLHPRKGTIAPGTDGDIAVYDPSKKVTLSHKTLHMNLDFNPFEGLEVTGWPKYTISRGRVLYRDGEFKGDTSHGQFIPRYYRDEEWEKISGMAKPRETAQV
jgi:dihydropyrimidinase